VEVFRRGQYSEKEEDMRGGYIRGIRRDSGAVGREKWREQ